MNFLGNNGCNDRDAATDNLNDQNSSDNNLLTSDNDQSNSSTAASPSKSNDFSIISQSISAAVSQGDYP